MIAARPLGRLEVGAASGLAVAAGLVWVVSDDALSVAAHAVRPEGVRLARRVRLFEGALPIEPEARKRAKPDLESLALLPDGALLALGSGSTLARRRGAFLPADVVAGVSSSAAGAVELAPLYAALALRFPELNIEGAAVAGEALVLLQRGNGPAGQNGLVALDLAELRGALGAGRPLGPDLVRAVREVDLGTLAGVRLGFTDGAPLGRGAILFTAAAEASPDTYRDGPCVGSVVGILSPDWTVPWMAKVTLAPAAPPPPHALAAGAGAALPAPPKLEGVHVTWTRDAGGPALDLLLVADADDGGVHGELYGATISSETLSAVRMAWLDTEA